MNKKWNYYTTFQFLWKYMEGMKTQYFLFYIGWLFHAVVGIFSPVVFGKMINQIVYDKNLQQFLKISLGFFAITVLGIVLYYAIYDNLTIGTITILLTYFTTLGTALSEVATNYMDAQKRMSMIGKICDFLKDESSEEEKKRHIKVTGINTLKFHDCTFAYNEELPVLDSVDFTICKGEKVAIVGNSGSGKTTLLNLILGLYQPINGEIVLDGANLKECERASLYGRVSVVFQQVLLLKGTIRENLQMGLEVSEERLIAACKAAGIYDYILQQKKGFDTVIEKYGKNLSGGQRQRLGIARAYLKPTDFVMRI